MINILFSLESCFSNIVKKKLQSAWLKGLASLPAGHILSSIVAQKLSLILKKGHFYLEPEQVQINL